MSDHFVSEALYLWDPDGLGLEIYADRPRSIWRAEGRQLYMTTEPLDVQGVLADAPPDDGSHLLPAGSVVGHMHLSVDDVDTASAFFHDGVGFDRVVWSYPGALFMSAGGYHHHLGTNTWSLGAPAATEEDARLVEWEVVLPHASDVAAAAANLAAKGHVAEATTGRARVVDPWGVGVVIRTSSEAR
jgi:catechol 2,3-dioxygenase